MYYKNLINVKKTVLINIEKLFANQQVIQNVEPFKYNTGVHFAIF